MSNNWKVGAGSSGEGLYWKAADYLGRLHLAVGIERDELGNHPEYDFGNPADQCVVVDTLVVWESGNPKPLKFERVMIPQAALVRALLAHEGPQGIMLAWLQQPGKAYLFTPPEDDLIGYASRWLDEFAHLRNGRVVVHYQNPDQPDTDNPPAAEVDPGPAWEQPQHRQPTPPAAPAAPAPATGNAAVDRERMEAPF